MHFKLVAPNRLALFQRDPPWVYADFAQLLTLEVERQVKSTIPLGRIREGKHFGVSVVVQIGRNPVPGGLAKLGLSVRGLPKMQPPLKKCGAVFRQFLRYRLCAGPGDC